MLTKSITEKVGTHNKQEGIRDEKIFIIQSWITLSLTVTSGASTTLFSSSSPEKMAFSTVVSSPLNFHTKNPNPNHSPPTFNKTKTKTLITPTKAVPPLSTATDVSAITAPFDSTTLAVLGGGSIAALAAVLSIADPEKRRQLQAEEVGGGDKEVVREYFNNSGFQRWKKIYGETDDVNKVQLDIRLGHSKTVENVMTMLTEEGSLEGVTVCDAGCGTGLLSIPLAKQGAIVSASDISAAMVAEAEKQAREALLSSDGSSLAPVMPKFTVSDLESLDGKYHTVVCLDVLIHYPQSKADAMIAHLASLADERLLLSFAPKTFYYDLLKRVGELFPGPSKATRAYLHAEADVERALQKVGWRIRKRGLVTTQFYFSKLVEAVPA
ncbi:Methyltransferase small domain [Macleaya cordata]|uniref:Methyltransferase small domain n=1 Tax=Macleaya cordata TaxID=56857 RepID=A0A200QGZ1_MACCD|nr:Methyltransferase small domain [Macleaya cordata]